MGLRYKCGMKRASLVGFLLALAPSSVVLAYCDTGFLIPVRGREWVMPETDPTRPPLPEPFTDEGDQVRRSPGIKGLWPGHPFWCSDFHSKFNSTFYEKPKEKELREQSRWVEDVRADCKGRLFAKGGMRRSALVYKPDGDVGLAGTLLGQKAIYKVTFEKYKVHKFTISMCEASASTIIPLLATGSQREKDANEKVRQQLARQTIDFLINKWGLPHSNSVVVTDKPRNIDWLKSNWKFRNALVEFYPGGLTLEVKAVPPEPEVSIKTDDF